MKVVVVTTSYPTPEHPVAGNFVASAVDAVRATGIDVEVVSPDRIRHFVDRYWQAVREGLSFHRGLSAFDPSPPGSKRKKLAQATISSSG